jgi:hypothetical protein
VARLGGWPGTAIITFQPNRRFRGPIGAILLLLTGRRAALAQLSGPGARELSAAGLDQDEFVAGAGTDTGPVRDK